MKNNIAKTPKLNLFLFFNLISWLLFIGSCFLLFNEGYQDIVWLVITNNLQSLFSYPFDSQQILIFLTIFSYFLLVMNLLTNLIFTFKYKWSKKASLSYLSLFLSIFIIFFIIFLRFINTNYSNCYDFFQFCKNGWHYETNKFGQRVDVHYKTDLKGNKLPNSFVGCGFDEKPKNYDLLIMSLSGVKKIEDDNNHTLYLFKDGVKGYLNKKSKPYGDDIITQRISDLMFLGTSCTENGLVVNKSENSNGIDWKLFTSKDLNLTLSTDDWSSFTINEENTNNNPFYSFQYPSNWVKETDIFLDENGKKIAELSPGLVILKTNQKCFDKKYDPNLGINPSPLILEKPIKVGNYEGVLRITETMYEGGSPNWNGTWYPNTYCLMNNKRAFVITFYEYQKEPIQTELYEKILSTLIMPN